MSDYQAAWQKLKQSIDNDRCPQSLLLVGSHHEQLLAFTAQLSQYIICQNRSATSCMQCVDCEMVSRGEHPDIIWIKPDKLFGPIKIDQIREMNQQIFLTAQRSKKKIIFIDSADSMNTAAANALLKTLEEPTENSLFVLLARQLSTILPTVLSRCQIIKGIADEKICFNNILGEDSTYTLDSEKRLLIQETEFALAEILQLLEKKTLPFRLITHWNKYDIHHVLWFLYLIYTQLLVLKFTQTLIQEPLSPLFYKLNGCLTPMMIFNQITKINAILKKLSHNMNINSTLVLEDLLFTLLEEAN